MQIDLYGCIRLKAINLDFGLSKEWQSYGNSKRIQNGNVIRCSLIRYPLIRYLLLYFGNLVLGRLWRSVMTS